MRFCSVKSIDSQLYVSAILYKKSVKIYTEWRRIVERKNANREFHSSCESDRIHSQYIINCVTNEEKIPVELRMWESWLKSAISQREIQWKIITLNKCFVFILFTFRYVCWTGMLDIRQSICQRDRKRGKAQIVKARVRTTKFTNSRMLLLVMLCLILDCVQSVGGLWRSIGCLYVCRSVCCAHQSGFIIKVHLEQSQHFLSQLVFNRLSIEEKKKKTGWPDFWSIDFIWNALKSIFLTMQLKRYFSTSNWMVYMCGFASFLFEIKTKQNLTLRNWLRGKNCKRLWWLRVKRVMNPISMVYHWVLLHQLQFV